MQGRGEGEEGGRERERRGEGEEGEGGWREEAIGKLVAVLIHRMV